VLPLVNDFVEPPPQLLDHEVVHFCFLPFRFEIGSGLMVRSSSSSAALMARSASRGAAGVGSSVSAKHRGWGPCEYVPKAVDPGPPASADTLILPLFRR
jgi:hypothetical protein